MPRKFDSIEQAMNAWSRQASEEHRQKFEGKHLDEDAFQRLISSQGGPNDHQHITDCMFCTGKLKLVKRVK